MKRNRNIKLVGVALICTALLTGCGQEPIEGQDILGDGETINATFTLAPDFVEEIEVRSVAGVDEKIIKDLWVVQLNAGGTAQLQDPQYITTGFTSTATDYKVSIPLKREASKIYFITNTDSPSAYTGKTTTAAVEAVTKAIASESDLASADGIPMAGVWTGTPDLLGIAGRISLSRAVAKVNFNLNALLPHGESFTLKSVTVRQVPKTLNYYRDANTLDTYPYPDLATPSVISDYSTTTYCNVNLIASPQALWWYLPENARGTGTATTQVDKGVKFPTNQSTYCTYIEVKGWYEAANGTYETIYKIYLGANNTTDYNLKRNTIYNVSTTIRGIDAADTRINTTDISIIVGMFGGWNDTKKEYTKLLQVDNRTAAEDEANLKQWATETTKTNATDSEYGANNISILKGLSPDLSAYPAARYCYMRNDKNGNGKIDANEPIEWYLPSQNQIMSIFIASEGIPTSFLPQGSYYWSSTEYQEYSWYIHFTLGGTSSSSKTSDNRVRCVKDITPNIKERSKVIVTADNRVVIDNRDMPASAITSLHKNSTTTATNNAIGTDEMNDLSSTTNNKTVSHYFEVAKSDIVGGTGLKWREAIDKCATLTDDSDNGKWRLPTQRELMLMWVLRKSLESKSSFSPFSTTGPYWSATEKNDNECIATGFLKGNSTTNNGKTNTTYLVRCIRDLTPQ